MRHMAEAPDAPTLTPVQAKARGEPLDRGDAALSAGGSSGREIE